MAGGQGGGSRQNRPLTGGMGAGVGQMGGSMTPQGTYPGGFAPAAPGGQMMMAGSGTPYGAQPQMPTQAQYQGQQQQQSPLSPAQQGGARAGFMPAFNQNPASNGGWNNWRGGIGDLGNAPPQIPQAKLNNLATQQQALNRRVNFYSNRPDATRQGVNMLRGHQQDLRAYRRWLNGGQQGPAPTDPATGQPTTPATPAVDPVTGEPAIDPVTGLPVDPATGVATDVYGHYSTDTGAGDGSEGVTPDPVTGQPRTRASALAQQIAALRGQMQNQRQSLLGSGVGAQGGPGDPRYQQMQQRDACLVGTARQGTARS